MDEEIRKRENFFNKHYGTGISNVSKVYHEAVSEMFEIDHQIEKLKRKQAELRSTIPLLDAIRGRLLQDELGKLCKTDIPYWDESIMKLTPEQYTEFLNDYDKVISEKGTHVKLGFRSIEAKLAKVIIQYYIK